jgi:hypothetical protein
MKHCQTSVRTWGFARGTIQPDCEMDIPVTYSDKNGTEKFDAVLGDIQTNEKFHYNLFSVTQMLLKGYKLEGNKHSLTLCNTTRLIVFDIIDCTQNEAFYCARFTRKLGKSETANPIIQGEEDSSKVAKKILKVNIKQAHDCLGRLSKNVTCKIAAQLGMELSRTAFQTCEACAIGKAKQHNIPKEASREKATIFNGRVGHNLLKIKAPEGMEVRINKSNWHIMVDKATGFKRSAFFKTKAGIVEYMCLTMHSKALRGHPIQDFAPRQCRRER